MGARITFSIASTLILKTHYVYIIVIVLNLQHTGVHYTCKSYEKVKKIDDFSRAPATKNIFVPVRAQARENLDILSYKGDKIALFDCSWQLLRKSALRDTP